ncbi:hypothetical protein HID58_072306 [Brassica napus]|uniref:Uncharacterized protein n=1 Tax=Brassica napus TaxID=3708 RepID=A0ABQ7Z479_BRANA|nr:hypothetical protein HID58_072306 [Brassica napus]
MNCTGYSMRYIQSTSATSGQGLYEGLEWLSNNIGGKRLRWIFSGSYRQSSLHCAFLNLSCHQNHPELHDV